MEKISSNYISRLLGVGIGKKEQEIAETAKKIVDRTKYLKRQKVIGKKYGFFGKPVRKPKYTDSDINFDLRHLSEKLENAKKGFFQAQKETYKTRRNTAIGGVAAGALGYGAKKKMDSYKQQNYGSTNYGMQNMASEETGLEKIAGMKDVLKGIKANVQKIGPGIKKTFSKGNLKKAPAALRDVATFKEYRSLRKNVKQLDKVVDGLSPGFGNNVEFSKLRNLKIEISRAQGKRDRADKLLKKLDPETANTNELMNKILNKVENKKTRFANDAINPSRSQYNRKKIVERGRDHYGKVYNNFSNAYNAGRDEVLRKKDVALSKSLGLYGLGAGAVGGTAYGINKKLKKKEDKK